MAAIMRPDQVTLPRLDVIRALCFLAVFGSHALFSHRADFTSTAFWQLFVVPVFYNGGLGVNAFFVLSGFLITFLLIREERMNGRIDVPRFWLRRVLRIWPLYFFVVLLGFGPLQWVKAAMGMAAQETADPWHYVFFCSNFDLARNDFPDSTVLTVLWSIAVEEQFYLVWPLLMLLIPSNRSPLLFGAIVAASIAFRWTHPTGAMRLWHTFSCMGDLAIGAAAAWYASRPGGPERIRNWPSLVIIGAHLMVPLLYMGIVPCDQVLFRCVFAVFVAMVILYQAFGRRTFLQLPTPPWLVGIGRISYGLYCLHQVAMLITLRVLEYLHWDQHLWELVVLRPLIALPLSLLMASLSYRFIERPFLRLKDRFSYIKRAD